MTSVERVRAICKEKKIAISTLEKSLGFSNGYIGKLRKGVFPDDRLVEIAKFLGVSVSYILGETDDPSDRSKTHWAELAYGQKEKPALSKEDEQKDVDEFLDGLTPAELVDLISKASAKLKGDGLL